MDERVEITEGQEPDRRGFDAISQALEKQYAGVEATYYEVTAAKTLKKRETLDGIEVRAIAGEQPFWLYVTYGFSELYEKECGDPDNSGYGFELTFRLKKGEETEPPVWPMNLLQELATYVFSTGNGFAPGHYMDCGGPISPEETTLTALAFQADPELAALQTPNGKVAFLQAVGLTAGEMEGLMCWNGECFLREMESFVPGGITDPARSSVMEREDFRAVWENGVKRDGSATSFLYVNGVSGEIRQGQGVLRVEKGRKELLRTMLAARVGKGRQLYLEGRDGGVRFQPGAEDRMVLKNSIFHMTLTEGGLDSLCRLLGSPAGRYQIEGTDVGVDVLPE